MTSFLDDLHQALITITNIHTPLKYERFHFFELRTRATTVLSFYISYSTLIGTVILLLYHLTEPVDHPGVAVLFFHDS